MCVQSIISSLGLKNIAQFPLSGGDTSQAWKIETHEGDYFLKINSLEKYPSLFESEVNSLEALWGNSSLIIPRVLKTDLIGGEQFLLLEWLESNSEQQEWEGLGTDLANLHNKPQPCFGWKENNYIGKLPQINRQHDRWETFYAQCRILPLVKNLFDNGVFSASDLKNAENLCQKLSGIFPDEPPALLHGDLWIGNIMFTPKGPACFDPASYYGHREMDIGMSLMFGGFNTSFYNTYHEVYPLEKNWRQRIPLTQLYPLLVHAALFNGHYIQTVRNILKQCK
ncbi:MAG: fructosamine kinase family protein [Bacteroidetes bacterium]|nr:fructosamine kinase family protein [Bacteroidota bacterium]